VHLFDDFVRTVPEGIYLTEIKQEGNQLTIKGVAESNGRVSAYMRNIDKSEWMATPKLKVIETKKGTLRSSDFTLITSQSSPDDKKNKNEGDDI
jgi:type IV pilus assembly protein PilN